MTDKNKKYLEEIQSLRSNIEAFAQNSELKEVVANMNGLRREKEQSEKQHTQLMAEYNKLANLIEDFTAENRHLRQHYNVPENFGIDLEAVKLLNREKIEDFRRLIKVLQEDNYKLEQERARLKHALKVQGMFNYSNVADSKIKSLLTPEQLESVN